MGPLLAADETLRADSDRLAASLRSVLVAVRSPAGGGSGTIWQPDGLVITNNHVAPGEHAEVELEDGHHLPARVVARDPAADLAALRVSARRLPACIPGDSDALRVGELVFAMGNPWGQRGWLTAGIVIARGPAPAWDHAPLDEAVHASVSLAPGNSGGPLADARGRVVGINAMIAGGMAIAIPSRTVERFLAGKQAAEAVLGLRGRAIPLPPALAASYSADNGEGLVITGVDPGSPAERAGFLPGDVVLRVDGSPGGFRRIAGRLRSLRAGVPVRFDLLRGTSIEAIEACPVARS